MGDTWTDEVIGQVFAELEKGEEVKAISLLFKNKNSPMSLAHTSAFIRSQRGATRAEFKTALLSAVHDFKLMQGDTR